MYPHPLLHSYYQILHKHRVCLLGCVSFRIHSVNWEQNLAFSTTSFSPRLHCVAQNSTVPQWHTSSQKKKYWWIRMYTNVHGGWSLKWHKLTLTKISLWQEKHCLKQYKEKSRPRGHDRIHLLQIVQMSFVCRLQRTEIGLQKTLLLNGEGNGCLKNKKSTKKFKLNQPLSLDPERFCQCVIWKCINATESLMLAQMSHLSQFPIIILPFIFIFP